MNKAEVSVKFNGLIRQVNESREKLADVSIDLMTHDTRLGSELNSVAGLLNRAAKQIEDMFKAEMDRLDGASRDHIAITMSDDRDPERKAKFTAGLEAVHRKLEVAAARRGMTPHDYIEHIERAVYKPWWKRLERWLMNKVFGGLK